VQKPKNEKISNFNKKQKNKQKFTFTTIFLISNN